MYESLLANVPLFSGMLPSEMELLCQQARRRSYPAKTQLIWRGEPGETLYIIQSGSVRVHNVTENGYDVTLSILKPGMWFGELSIIDQSARSADITSIERTDCLIVDGVSLRRVIERNPAIALHMLRHLAKTIRQMNDSYEIFTSLNVPGRIARLLIQLARNHGTSWAPGRPEAKAANATIISVNLTRGDIKSFVGATREHVTKIMADFTRRGYIMNDPVTGNIVILDMDKLSSQAR